MKIALCLYGRYNNRYSKNSGNDGTEYIANEIIAKTPNGIDVFIHSSDLESQAIIEKKYSKYIKQSIFEQKNFREKIKEKHIDESIFVPIGGRDISSLSSFLYSRSRSIELKREFETANNFKYDIVIASRFDLGQIDKYNGNHTFRVSEINFNPEFDMSYIYAAYYEQLNQGFADQWFYSNSENMDILSKMYEESFKYYKKDSDYIKSMTNGWVDSNRDEEFSNEMLKSSEFNSKNLLTFKIDQCLNIHTMHKWFFWESGLYSVVRFV